MSKRPVEVIVISDLHLGTFGCQAEALLTYLQSVQPQKLILNGDIIDIWQFSKNRFQPSHMAVVKQIIQMATSGTEVIYITGNHDEAFRRYAPITFGPISLVNKYILELDQKKYICFHGDAFDRTTKGSARILAKIGGWGYDLLIMFNYAINHISALLNGKKYSLSKKIKHSVKEAVKWISNFEYAAAAMASEQQFDGVICGHIHVPFIKSMPILERQILYMNSGDWIEHCSALEFQQGSWNIYIQENLPDPENIKDWFDKDQILQVILQGQDIFVSA